tara:strand:+ start:1312 stop:1860 length:549 start_codon:yes stop_codon:yes gene_type:complete
MTKLFEGLEQNDLARLVAPSLHFDEYESKMGKDEDVCVVSYKVTGKLPAQDLVNFIEKGYEWCIDADISAGELEDGDYLVFVEIERTKDLPDQVMQMVNDVLNLTGQKIGEWKMRIRSDKTDHELTEENIAQMVPLNKQDYRARYGTDKKLDEMRTAAGVTVNTKAEKNDRTQKLRAQAGIL